MPDIKEKKPRPELGATFATCPKCNKRVNATWLGKDMCIYCKQDMVLEKE